MILVVGGAGYIGSHMCKLLRECAMPHVVFDNLEKGHRAALPGSDLVVGDVREAADVRDVLRAHPIDLVMHFAAYTEVGESVRDPSRFYWNNVVGVAVLLDAMRDAGVETFVFSSTAAIYGEPRYTPIDEDHPTLPTSPYGDTKLAVERMLAGYERAYGVRSVSLRYFNAAGADPDGIIGEDHTPESHLIPSAILAAMGARGPLEIFGTDYDTEDGTCVRDFIHIMDLARAHLSAVDHLRAGGESRRYNLGSGSGYSVRQVLDSVSRVTGLPVPANDAPRRPGDPAKLIASSERIRADWKWSPEFPSLDDIVAHSWTWRRANPNGYRAVAT